MRQALTVAWLGLYLSVSAQTDSLELVSKNLERNQKRADVLNQLGSQFRDKNNRNALSYSQEAFKISDSLKYDEGKAISLENLGWILYRLGDYTQSLSYSLHALELNEALLDSVAIARCLNNVGAIGFEDENYAEAIIHFKRAYAITIRLNDSQTSARSLNNLALAYFRIQQYDSSKYFAQQSLKTSAQQYLNSFAYRTLGDLSVARKQYDEASAHFKKCLKLAQAAGNTFMETSVKVRMGTLATTTHDYKQAEMLFNQVVMLSKQVGYKNELESSFDGLSRLYEKQGSLSKALYYKTKYAELHDSLRVESHRERLAFLQYQHGAEIQKANLQLLTQQNLLDEKTISNQRLLIFTAVGGILILLIGIVLVFGINQRISFSNHQLALKSEEIKRQADELRDLNHSKDKLFQLLSHDLRGPVRNLKDVFDMLTAGHITQEEFKQLSSLLKPALDNLYLDLNNLLYWSKSQLSGIQTNSKNIQVKPLIADLVERARDLAHQKKLNISELVFEATYVVADTDHLSIILRNLLSNAIKFSNDDGNIWVEATSENGQTRICVKDEGVGLTAEEISKIKEHLFFTKPGTHRETGTGIGLTLINEFLKANKGYVEIDSQPGKGSAFTVVLPSNG